MHIIPEALAHGTEHAVAHVAAVPSFSDTIFHLPPLHPLVVHFPIAFFLSAGLLGLWALVRESDHLTTAVRWLLYAGWVSALVATATGLYFEEFVPHRHGGMIGPIMTWHERLGIATAVCSTLIAAAAFRTRHRPSQRQRWLSFAAVLLACAMLCTSHLGGLLVHRFGIGIMDDMKSSHTAPTKVLKAHDMHNH